MALAKVKSNSSGGKGHARMTRRTDAKDGARKIRRAEDAAAEAGRGVEQGHCIDCGEEIENCGCDDEPIYQGRPLDAADVMLAHVYGGARLTYGPFRPAFT